MDERRRAVCAYAFALKLSPKAPSNCRGESMAEAKNWYVICYDITEPKRWRVVYKKLHGYGRRLQYSIFRCRLTVRQMERLHWELEEIMASDDRLLIIRLCDGCERHVAAHNRPEAWQVEAKILRSLDTNMKLDSMLRRISLTETIYTSISACVATRGPSMLLTLIPITPSAVFSPFEMLAYHAIPWLSRLLHYSVGMQERNSTFIDATGVGYLARALVSLSK